MTEDKLKVFAVLLHQLKKKTEDQTIDTSAFKQEKVVEEYENAAIIVNQTIITKLLRRKALYLKQIDNALRKIDSGDYGYCEECEEEISEKRLEVRLTAEFCIPCKERQEKMAKEVSRFGINDWESSKEPEDEVK